MDKEVNEKNDPDVLLKSKEDDNVFGEIDKQEHIFNLFQKHDGIVWNNLENEQPNCYLEIGKIRR